MVICGWQRHFISMKNDFKKIQVYMFLAKKENAMETYAKLKEEYLTLKALLQVSGVNMEDIDRIKE